MSLRYIFIGGLEHSGTTLLAQLLASQPKVLSLGEVAQFLSRSHMQEYLRRWGAFPDVRRCSCGQDWSECEFWSSLMHLNGAFEDDRIADGYLALLSHMKSVDDVAVVDSSKSRQHLQAFMTAWRELGLSIDQAGLVVMAKDPRGFAHSMGKKAGNSATLLSFYRSMNWWNKIYAQWVELESTPVFRVKLLPYEQLCENPRRALAAVFRQVETELSDQVSVTHSNSHIALGNKDFTERNRQQIVYDAAWKKDWRIRLAYQLNGKARATYTEFERKAS